MIVFQAFHNTDNAILIALEIDNTIVLTMTTTTMTSGNTALVITTTRT